MDLGVFDWAIIGGALGGNLGGFYMGLKGVFQRSIEITKKTHIAGDTARNIGIGLTVFAAISSIVLIALFLASAPGPFITAAIIVLILWIIIGVGLTLFGREIAVPR